MPGLGVYFSQKIRKGIKKMYTYNEISNMTIEEVNTAMERVERQLDWLSYADHFTPEEREQDAELRREMFWMRNRRKALTA